MPDTPTHGFVVPAYGRSPHLVACLESLRSQTVASTITVTTSTPYPGIEDLAEEFGAKVLTHSPNLGIGHDWNFALSRADANWVTIAHQDDIYLPTFVERTLALSARVPEALLLLTGYAEMMEPAGLVRSSTMLLRIKRMLLETAFLGRNHVSSVNAKLRLLRFGCPIPCPSVTISINRFNLQFNEDLKVNLDWDAWLRLAREPGAFAYDRKVLMLHRIHAGSETTAGIRKGVRALEDRMIFESLWPRPIAHLLATLYAISYSQGTRP